MSSEKECPSSKALQAIQEREAKMRSIVKESGAINFEQLGRVVTQISSSVLNDGMGGIAADDYVAKVYDSAIHLYKMKDLLGGLERMQVLGQIATDIRGR